MAIRVGPAAGRAPAAGAKNYRGKTVTVFHPAARERRLASVMTTPAGVGS